MKRRILLADDSVTIQKVIELTFLDEDYEVKAVSNGDAAIAALAEVRPDFVIADVHMPGANGYEVCRRAKQTHPGVPVLLLVGTFEPFDEGQMRQVGADSFLKKPFDSQELLERVESLLGQGAAPAAQVPPPLPEVPAFPAPAAVPAPAARPSFASELPPFELPPLGETGSEFSFEPSPGPEPFDREPSFDLGPPPSFAVREEEPIFTFDEPAAEPLRPAEPFAWAIPAPAEASPSASLDEPLTWNPPPAEPEWSVTPAEPEWNVEATEPPAAAEWASPAPPVQPPEELAPAPVYTAAAPVWQAPAAEPQPAAAAPASSNGGGELSDEDVDRIARRLVELLGDRAIRDVAWEVVPDLAEVIIRDRLRELESQADQL